MRFNVGSPALIVPHHLPGNRRFSADHWEISSLDERLGLP